MRKAQVLVNDIEAGELEKLKDEKDKFTYFTQYQGPPVSLTMHIQTVNKST